MKVLKEVMEDVASELNSNYFTIAEVAKELGYNQPRNLAEKVKKLNLGYRIKGICLLSQEDKKILNMEAKKKGK